MTASLPAKGRLVGIDFGTVRIGIAISDAEHRLASPYENYTCRDREADGQYFVELIAAENVVGFVVGLPVHGSGEESAKSLEARQFGRWLTEITALPVTFYDERYTTAQAEQMLTTAELTSKRRKKRLDMVAAQIILASYLESSGQDNGPPPPLDH
ncbi:MAG: Holliday junction resolvase RuvX [Pirellulaceae bacterium]